jgi:hypothetical protein
MSYATFLILGAALAWPQDTEDAKRALAIIKKAEGTIEFDEKAPGRPLVALNL